MQKKIQERYDKQRNALMDKNYERSTEKAYRALQKEYKRVLDEINAQLLEWESIRANNEKSNSFSWSEEKSLKETKKAIELLLNELAENEYKLLSDTLDELYAQDLLDMNKLEIEYLQYRSDLELEYMADYMRKNPFTKASIETVASFIPMVNQVAVMSAIANRTDTIMWIEQILRQPIDVDLLSQDIWYVGFDNTSYDRRIGARIEQLKKEINQAVTQMYAQGKPYKYAIDRISERLGVSEYYCQRLIQTEARVSEVQANTKHYVDMGVQYFGRQTVADKNVCKECKKHKDDVYTSEELARNPWIAILHPGDRCIIEPLSQQRGEERYANRSNK